MTMARTILSLMNALGLFKSASWDAWRVVLRAIYGLPITDSDLAVYRRLTGRQRAPVRPFREVWLIVGRRGGKSFISSLIAVYAVTCRTYVLSPGEVGTFMIVAADRKQARVVKCTWRRCCARWARWPTWWSRRRPSRSR